MDNIGHDYADDTRRPSAVDTAMAVAAAVILFAAILAFALVTS